METTTMPKLRYFAEYGSECPKCNNRYREIRHHAAKPPGVGMDGCHWPDEHLHLTCERCRYEWACAPKDVNL